MNNNKYISEDAKKILKEKGINPENIKNTNANKLLENLNADDRNRINDLLNDKEALESLLNSDKAKAIMKKLFGAK